ncbi:unnamed protein product, partial [Candidula unifasciata]
YVTFRLPACGSLQRLGWPRLHRCNPVTLTHVILSINDAYILTIYGAIRIS